MMDTFLPPESDWKPVPVHKLPCWGGLTRISIDTETCDPSLKEYGIGVRRDGYVVGISFAVSEKEGYYLPIRHSNGGNFDYHEVMSYLKENINKFRGEVVGMNLSYDLDYLNAEGLFFHSTVMFRDVAIADALIDERHQSYSLENISKRYGLSGKNEQKLKEAAESFKVHPKSGLFKLHAKYVAEYAIDDAILPLKIFAIQERLIKENNLQNVFDIESNLLPVLLRMRQRGVLIDNKKLEYLYDKCLLQEKNSFDFIYKETGVELDDFRLNKKRYLIPILNKIGAPLIYTDKGVLKIDKNYLQDVNHPVTNQLLLLREANKLRTTFVTPMAMCQTKGRVHCTFVQIVSSNYLLSSESDDTDGTRYGRLSCKDPNLQNQPSRGVWGKLFREIFLPESGKMWASVDYSQQEPRWLSYYGSKLDVQRYGTGGLDAVEAYKNNADLDNYTYLAEAAGISRKEAKTLFLAQVYGQSLRRLCFALGVSESEGDAVVKKLHQKVPYINGLKETLLHVLDSRGYIKTIAGRQIHAEKRHSIINALLQGTSADQMKMACIAIDKAGHFLQLSVHDETCSSVESKEEAEQIAEIQREIIKVSVPFKVDVELGTSWGESMK